MPEIPASEFLTFLLLRRLYKITHDSNKSSIAIAKKKKLHGREKITLFVAARKRAKKKEGVWEEDEEREASLESERKGGTAHPAGEEDEMGTS